MQKLVATSLASLMFAGTLSNPMVAEAQTRTATPIKHLVVIFQENISFDHYFGTYPNALNPPGEPVFKAASGTPAVNGFTDGLLFSNPNFLNTQVNAAGAANPFRLDRSEAATSDQDHDYLNEQQAFNGGMMDSFPKFTGTPGPPPAGQTTPGIVMGYYDGNTVTALWNYAQRFAMSDDSYGTNFGPSTDGAVNLISGQLNGVVDQVNATADIVPDGGGGYTLVSDADPVGDMCSTTTGAQVAFSGTNVGDLLNSKGISWGFFEGGFDLTLTNANGTPGCMRSTTSAITGVKKLDYIPHHQPFQYYASTAEPGAHPADFAQHRGHRWRPRKSPVRHSRLLRCNQRRQLPHRQLPQGAWLSGRPRGLLRSTGRADVRDHRYQFPAEAQGLGEHRSGHRLRRFRRMV